MIVVAVLLLPTLALLLFGLDRVEDRILAPVHPPSPRHARRQRRRHLRLISSPAPDSVTDDQPPRTHAA
ncbi:hypothetical protein [Streptomyces sp. NPDC052225]|uniref:hypothetical protein n=1 Tax=Streptomyces sp. NPDC052225 TaxID=3154949 RepID=UPI003414C451